MKIRRINSGEIFYYHTNHLGSTAFVTEQSQNVVQGFLYAPFGEIITEYNANFASSMIPKYSFNAKELDEETGMYYFEARYYRVHTFISRDPLMNEKPWLTPYHYCSNNPIGRIDPSGMSDDWYQDADGNVKWDENVTSQADLKQEEKYIGKTVGWINDNGLHKGDENGNITTKDLHVTIIGNRNTEGIKDIEGQTLTINASSIGYNKTPWMDIAKTQIGVTKAIGHNDGVQIEKYLKSVGLGKGHPWCAAFVNWCLNQAGNEGAGARRNNYLNWGIPLNEPKYGAVAIFNTGHVGFYAEKNGENYKILHGNWSDKVSFSTNIKPSEIKFFRFPK